jgi:hypothetical protein
VIEHDQTPERVAVELQEIGPDQAQAGVVGPLDEIALEQTPNGLWIVAGD